MMNTGPLPAAYRPAGNASTRYWHAAPAAAAGNACTQRRRSTTRRGANPLPASPTLPRPGGLHAGTARFFGREADTARVFARLEQTGFVSVVGGSAPASPRGGRRRGAGAARDHAGRRLPALQTAGRSAAPDGRAIDRKLPGRSSRSASRVRSVCARPSRPTPARLSAMN